MQGQKKGMVGSWGASWVSEVLRALPGGRGRGDLGGGERRGCEALSQDSFRQLRARKLERWWEGRVEWEGRSRAVPRSSDHLGVLPVPPTRVLP